MTAPVKVCVVVPTYNERENVQSLVDSVKLAGVSGLCLLFVDDTSPDGTAELIREIASRDAWVKVLVRGEKKGIGSAYQYGFREALSNLSPEVIVEMDADLQHPPSEIIELVRALEAGAEVAVGSRYVPGGAVVGWGFWRRIVSRGANAFARGLLGLPVKDATSGFRAFSRRAATEVSEADLPANGFEFQVASLHLLKTKMKIVEVPYSFSARKAGKSKLGLADMARFFVGVIRMLIGGP